MSWLPRALGIFHILLAYDFILTGAIAKNPPNGSAESKISPLSRDPQLLSNPSKKTPLDAKILNDTSNLGIGDTLFSGAEKTNQSNSQFEITETKCVDSKCETKSSSGGTPSGDTSSALSSPPSLNSKLSSVNSNVQSTFVRSAISSSNTNSLVSSQSGFLDTEFVNPLASVSQLETFMEMMRSEVEVAVKSQVPKKKSCKSSKCKCSKKSNKKKFQDFKTAENIEILSHSNITREIPILPPGKASGQIEISDKSTNISELKKSSEFEKKQNSSGPVFPISAPFPLEISKPGLKKPPTPNVRQKPASKPSGIPPGSVPKNVSVTPSKVAPPREKRPGTPAFKLHPENPSGINKSLPAGAPPPEVFRKQPFPEPSVSALSPDTFKGSGGNSKIPAPTKNGGLPGLVPGPSLISSITKKPGPKTQPLPKPSVSASSSNTSRGSGGKSEIPVPTKNGTIPGLVPGSSLISPIAKNLDPKTTPLEPVKLLPDVVNLPKKKTPDLVTPPPAEKNKTQPIPGPKLPPPEKVVPALKGNSTEPAQPKIKVEKTSAPGETWPAWSSHKPKVPSPTSSNEVEPPANKLPEPTPAPPPPPPPPLEPASAPQPLPEPKSAPQPLPEPKSAPQPLPESKSAPQPIPETPLPEPAGNPAPSVEKKEPPKPKEGSVVIPDSNEQTSMGGPSRSNPSGSLMQVVNVLICITVGAAVFGFSA